MNHPLIYSVLLSAGLLVSNIALSQPTPASPSKTSGEIIKDSASSDEKFQLAEAVVTNIDANTRTITLKSKDGEKKFIAGPEIKNFSQIKVGDLLNVTYELAVAVELIKTSSSGIRSEQVTTTTTTAKPGDKPSQIIVNTTTIVSDVVGVDLNKKTVSIKGPDGKMETLKVQDQGLLNDVKVNDQVRVVFTDSMAASFSAPVKK